MTPGLHAVGLPSSMTFYRHLRREDRIEHDPTARCHYGQALMRGLDTLRRGTCASVLNRGGIG